MNTTRFSILFNKLKVKKVICIICCTYYHKSLDKSIRYTLLGSKFQNYTNRSQFQSIILATCYGSNSSLLLPLGLGFLLIEHPALRRTSFHPLFFRNARLRISPSYSRPCHSKWIGLVVLFVFSRTTWPPSWQPNKRWRFTTLLLLFSVDWELFALSSLIASPARVAKGNFIPPPSLSISIIESQTPLATTPAAQNSMRCC